MAAAAAVLRYAAKRWLGGRAFQRPQRNYTAAADNIQGRRTVRPTSSSRSCYGTPNSSTKHACAKSTEEPLAQKNKEYLASNQQKDIDSKTEELFHLIAKMDRELPSHCNKDNRQLLMHLSILVQPKPDDSQWRFYRRAVRPVSVAVSRTHLSRLPCQLLNQMKLSPSMHSFMDTVSYKNVTFNYCICCDQMWHENYVAFLNKTRLHFN